MNTTIWKFPLRLAVEQTIEVPLGAVGLHCDLQDERPCIWVCVDPEAERTTRRIIMVGTGNPHPDLAKPTTTHIGTVQMNGYVWHYFEVGKP